MAYQASNRRMAKNTMFLYIRMFVWMVVSLYTSRIVLKTLGEADFGIYSVVAGFIVLIAFVNNAMVVSTQRFLTFELGRDDGQAEKVFLTCLKVHLGLASIIFILAETLGLWFLNNYMNFPPGRVQAAGWVYQFAVLSCMVEIVRAPYNAVIIAHEKMSFYAYLSILEGVLKLLIVYLLLVIPADRLITYSILTFSVTSLITVTYKIYSNRNYPISRYRRYYDKGLLKKILNFSFWSLLGNGANIVSMQRVNMIMNLFYGVLLNAAMGIMYQVHSAISAFSSNFQKAFGPQIVKSYASEDLGSLNRLISTSSKLSYFLILVIAMPVMFFTDRILNLWLTIVPQYTSGFVKMTVLVCIIDALAAPLWNVAMATGKIRKYNMVVSSLLLLNIPLAYLLLRAGYNPISVMAVRAGLSLILYIFRLSYIRRIVSPAFCIRSYLTNVVVRCAVSTATAVVPMVLIVKFCPPINLFLIIGICLLITLSSIYWTGITRRERRSLNDFVRSKVPFL